MLLLIGVKKYVVVGLTVSHHMNFFFILIYIYIFFSGLRGGARACSEGLFFSFLFFPGKVCF